MGICIPGVITCPGVGDGDAVGICMPGVITCGLGEAEGRARSDLLVGARLAGVTVFFFLGAVFRFGLLIPGILLMSCCGNALTLTPHTKTSAPSDRSALLQLLGLFMFSPS